MKKEKEAAIKALRKDGRVRKMLTEIPKELSEKFTFSLRDLAKRHNISYGKTSKLIERLYRNKVLVIKAIPNYHVLGLKPIFLIVKPEIENWLDKAFKMTYFKFGSWIYGNGKYALITLIPPLDKIKNHLSYVEANIGKIKEYHILNRLLPAAPNLDYLFEAKTPWNKLPMREAREVLFRLIKVWRLYRMGLGEAEMNNLKSVARIVATVADKGHVGILYRIDKARNTADILNGLRELSKRILGLNEKERETIYPPALINLIELLEQNRNNRELIEDVKNILVIFSCVELSKIKRRSK